MIVDACPTCGRPLDTHDRQMRFALPDPVLDTRKKEKARGTWMSHRTPRESVMMQVPKVGAFVRVLMPIKLTDGHSVTFSLWLAIDPAELQTIYGVWWEPAYRDLRIKGWLANAVPPWGLLAAPVEAAVRDADQTPYCERSDDRELERVLRDEWSHEWVLAAIDE